MLDQAIVIAYMIAVLIIGLLSGRKINSLHEYAIGKRNYSNSLLIAALFASMAAASGTSGLSGKIYSHGLIFLYSYLGIIVSRLLVAFFIAPKMEKFLGLTSAGDIFEKLYGKNAKILVGLLTSIEGPLLTSAQILATYQAAQYFLGIPKVEAAIISSLTVLFYSLRGGIRAVSTTDVFQFAVLLIAVPITCAIAISKIGGYSQLSQILEDSPMVFSGFKGDLLLRHMAIFISFAIPCLFPLTLQRMLMAKNAKQIKITFLTNAAISVPFYVSIGVIGICASILLPNIDPNFALPALIDHVLPAGIRGFVIAGILAIFMSSADSDINMSSVAITHDILHPIFGKKITTENYLFIVRTIVVIVTIFSTIVALFFTNALDIMFIVMCLGDSVRFPGYLLGILGYPPNKTYFWIGAISGGLTALIMSSAFGIFPIYGMLCAMTLNLAIISIPICGKWFQTFKSTSEGFSMGLLKNKIDLFGQFAVFKNNVKNKDYFDIIAIFTIANSVFPFFIHAPQFDKFTSTLIWSNLISSVLAFLLLMRDFHPAITRRYVGHLWHSLVLISLPFQAFVTIFVGKMSFIDLMNLLTVSTLLFIILRRTEAILHLLLAFFLAGTTHWLFGDTANFDQGAWSLFINGVTLVLCILLFRQRDVDAYKFMSEKLAHEAGRSLSAVRNSALILEKRLLDPSASHGLLGLEKIPKTLIEMTTHSSNNINKLLAIMRSENDSQKRRVFSAKACLDEAINDPAFANTICNNVNTDGFIDFHIEGNYSQIYHVFLNLIENAIHATHGNDLRIKIWTKNSCLYFEDNGMGVHERDLPNIFDSLFSTKGTAGQGLSFCKLVLEQHGGEISCTSQKGVFTRFKLTFPELPEA